VVFAAARGRAVPLGVFRQLIGDAAFGAAGFQYCGNVLGTAADSQFGRDDAIVDAACALARGGADAFGLVGVNGIDFVAREGIAYAIEINPRWCASIELVERAYGLSVFAIHAAACDSGMLPDFNLLQTRAAARRTFAKAVVFAREDVTVGDTRGWMPRVPVDVHADIRDIPRPDTRIRAGRPVCTVFAEGADEAACYAALVARAGRVYADLRTLG
jgi:predicted ATP-grasp superfamily ATP-dependent carboligase